MIFFFLAESLHTKIGTFFLCQCACFSQLDICEKRLLKCMQNRGKCYWVGSQRYTLDENTQTENEVNRSDSIRRQKRASHITVHLACSYPCSNTPSLHPPPVLFLPPLPPGEAVMQHQQFQSGILSVLITPNTLKDKIKRRRKKEHK